MKTENWRILEKKGLQSRKISNFHGIYVKSIIMNLGEKKWFFYFERVETTFEGENLWKFETQNATKIEFLLLESKKVNFT